MIYVSPHMLPEDESSRPEHAPPLFTGQTIVIAPITGVGSSNSRALAGALGVPRTAVIWSQTFHEALFKAVGNSGLFGQVARDGTARYILQADIVQQSTAGYSATFKVHYVLNDSQWHRSLWEQDIAASYALPGSLTTFVMPYNTQLDALMRACGKNIGILIQSLGTIPPAAPSEP
jgi:hypothetical protein